MAEYKNGVNAFGNMTVSKEDRSSEVHTGRAVFVDEDKYSEDPDYKLKVDKCLAEGFHRVGDSGGGGGSSDFSTAQVTVTAPGGNYYIPNVVDGEYSLLSASVFFGTQGTQNFTVPLYKGVVSVLFDNNTIEGSGNVEIHGEVAIITGDCTITISDGNPQPSM